MISEVACELSGMKISVEPADDQITSHHIETGDSIAKPQLDSVLP